MILWAASGFALAAGAGLVALALARRGGRAQAQPDTRGRQLEALQQSFNRFVPAHVVDDIAAKGAARSAQRREVTVLFADLQGFTSLSEHLDASVLVAVLNRYFTAMSVAIHEHHGHVSKFIGDGVMALFGAVSDNPWQARDGVQAAIAMQQAADHLNAELVAEGLPKLSVGIGLHKGEVVAGILGSEQLMEFTVIGDVVNVAARVESLTRTHGAEILITQAVRDGLDPGIRLEAKPAAAVKGKTEPVATWSVLR